MLYACAFRPYYFIKGSARGRVTRAHYCRNLRDSLHTLQLLSFEKHIKTTSYRPAVGSDTE